MEDNSIPIMEQTHSITIQTDASHLGWGAVCQGETTGNHCSTEEQEARINILELKAAHLTIQLYLKKDLEKECQLPEKRLLLQIENATAVAYINKRGGTKAKQAEPTHTAGPGGLETMPVSQISLVAQYLPGLENVEAEPNHDK